MRIAVGSDHRGFTVKSKVIELFRVGDHRELDDAALRSGPTRSAAPRLKR